MLNLYNVTLVSVSSIHIEATINALKYSMRGINYGATKLITHEVPKIDYSGIDIVLSSRINSLDNYSEYMIYNLHSSISTEYCLIVQSDGFVVNPDSWRPDFLYYDYVGAPWPANSYIDDFGDEIRVGNGGFSLRSKRLLKLASEENIPFEPYRGNYNEDGFYCMAHRRKYLEKGMVYAPVDIAKHFSHEIMIPEVEGIIPFGFHNYRGTNNNYPRF